jgi:streptomycin 6-kinase
MESYDGWLTGDDATSALLPVLWSNVPAMLKVAVLDEEKLGNQLMF